MTKSDVEVIREVFGEQSAEIVARRERCSWSSIPRALTTDYQKWELNPPENNPISEARPNTRIKICEDTISIKEKAKIEYKLKSDTEAFAKLLRYGLSSLAFRWKTEITLLNEIREACTIASVHLYTDDFTLSVLEETEGIEIPARQPAGKSSKQTSLLWYENQIGSRLSEKLGINMTDLFYCGILLAGKEMARIGDIPEPQNKKITEQIEKADTRIKRNKDRAEQLAFGAIIKVATSNQSSKEVFRELKTNCPNFWERYLTVNKNINDTIDYL